MRQKIEVREQDTVRKASYVCASCKRNYDALDVGKLYNETSQELMYVYICFFQMKAFIFASFRCWQCNGKVINDETAGPSEETRSSLVKFNEQMAGWQSKTEENSFYRVCFCFQVFFRCYKKWMAFDSRGT